MSFETHDIAGVKSAWNEVAHITPVAKEPEQIANFNTTQPAVNADNMNGMNLTPVAAGVKQAIQTENTVLDSADVAHMNLQCAGCLLYTSPSPRDQRGSRMPSSA